MSTDNGRAGVRERVWITKVDHEADPPRPVEEVFIENGVIVSVTPIEAPQQQQEEQTCQTTTSLQP